MDATKLENVVTLSYRGGDRVGEAHLFLESRWRRDLIGAKIAVPRDPGARRNVSRSDCDPSFRAAP